MIYKIKDTEKVKKLFDSWDETMIWSCLQNVMGTIYVDSTDSPVSAMAHMGDFCFLAGKANEELIQYWNQKQREFIIMVPGTEAWADLIETVYKDKATMKTRYALKKEADVFDKDKLQSYVESLPKEYELKLIDETIYHKCRKEEWTEDMVGQYDTYEMYKKCGLGVVAFKDDEMVAGASSYSSYRGGIEIEIDTKEEFRRKGLASACGARLILECLERGLYPSWDAANLWSVGLAEKLGYHFDYEYKVYDILF